MRILLTGPQGSGKTTQAEIISQKKELYLIIVGDMLRDRTKLNDELARKIKRDQSNGVLVDSEIVGAILKEKISAISSQKGFIIDGWPRNMDQLKLFDPNYDLILNLKVSEEVSLQRLLKRGRVDDTKEAIQKRLAIYYKQTQQVLDFYRQKGLVIDINGDQDVDTVAVEIEKTVNRYE